eukprot:NODE_3743_length_736_cov_63.558952_g3147_i0.p1 GENE.NODE_3743_length_736_cov_63.558952_g3147_i0~~NODE_3743_length_736_cov_63.558952_g3147_i0.p1  ORF type:complete len:216 (-),score=48.07 NODE_3743_length_736_cov_63.558952_g3147_i0:88-642(-)
MAFGATGQCPKVPITDSHSRLEVAAQLVNIKDLFGQVLRLCGAGRHMCPRLPCEELPHDCNGTWAMHTHCNGRASAHNRLHGGAHTGPLEDLWGTAQRYEGLLGLHQHQGGVLLAEPGEEHGARLCHIGHEQHECGLALRTRAASPSLGHHHHPSTNKRLFLLDGSYLIVGVSLLGRADDVGQP